MDHSAFVFRPEPGRRLRDLPTDSVFGFALLMGEPESQDEQQAQERMREDATEMAKYQDILMAHQSHGLLVLFQGMDAGGKDEAIRHKYPF